MGGKNGEAADDVGEHILQGQGNGQGQDACQSDDAGDVNAKAGGHAQTQQDIHGHLGERQNQAVGGLFQVGFFQSPLKQLCDDANDQKANDQHENGVEHLIQRAGSQSGKKFFRHGKHSFFHLFREAIIKRERGNSKKKCGAEVGKSYDSKC